MAKATRTASTVTPKILASYQTKVVCEPWYETLSDGTERARISTFVKSRRIGGSVAAAYRSALWAAGLEMQADGTAVVREPMDVIIVSKDFVGSKRLLREVADALSDLGRAGPEFDCDPQATTIKLRNGRTVEAVPCSDKAIRSNTAAVCADEFAFWRRQQDCWAAIKSVTDPNWKYPKGLPALFVTTPWEEGSLAHQIFEDDSFPFHRHSVDIHQAVEAGFPVNVKEEFARLGIPELIASEYLCQWSKGISSFFPIAKLRDCQEDDKRDVSGLPSGWEQAPATFGIDVGGGRGRDFTAGVQWRTIGDDVWMVGVKAKNDLEHDEQIDYFGNWILDTDPGAQVEVRIDQGMMGVPFLTSLRKKLKGRRRTNVTGVGMMPADQERYAKAGKRLLEQGRLKLYSGADAGGDEHGVRALMLELSSLKTRPGEGGRLTFATPRDATGHRDRAWAALIGLEDPSDALAALTADQMNRLRSVGRTGSRWGGMPGRGFG